MRLMRQLHKWTALIVGIQVLLWLVSGLAMSLFDEQEVSGAVSAAFEHDVELLPVNGRIAEPAGLAASAAQPLREIELKRQSGKWVWRVESEDQVQLYDAIDGSSIEIDEAYVRGVAAAGYDGTGKPKTVTLLSSPTLEARGHSIPMWKVDFDDRYRTSFYISADEGRILERRNDTWRWFDLFWMLHTMDYAERDNFNNPWVIAVAFASVWLAVSGIVLLVKSLAPRRNRAPSHSPR